MEVWQFFNRVEALCRNYDVFVQFNVRNSDCVYINLLNGEWDYNVEFRWNFMKQSSYMLFGELEKELKRFKAYKEEHKNGYER